MLIPVLLMIGLIAFFLIHLVPGDPVVSMLGMEATPAIIMDVREQLGLDKPLMSQCYAWFKNLILKGDLGTAIAFGRSPVSLLLRERIRVTYNLALVSFVVSLLIGIPAGLFSARQRGTALEYALMLFANTGYSMPSFWLGLMLLYFFAVQLGWFSSGGYVSPLQSLSGYLRTITLPAFTLGLVQAAYIARITRSSALEVCREDYMTTARAKGLSERKVLWKHEFKNALIPIVTALGLNFGLLLGGAVVTEQIFMVPGIGKLLILAVDRRDYTVVQAILLFAGANYAVINVLTDTLYCYIDPRVSYD